AEILREKKIDMDLSEGFIVYETYLGKADQYVRYHGTASFSQGGLCHDLLWTIKNYGLVPESIYTGMVAPDTLFVHGELTAAIQGLLDGVLKNNDRALSTNWRNAFTGALNGYMQAPPETFEYNGVTYTPKSFAKDYLGVNADDYVNVTSFTHHPFYEKFVIELPDNWLRESVYNVPLDDMMRIIDNAIENGYTINWASDVSNKGFSSKNGVAIIPDRYEEATSGSDAERWNGKKEAKDLYSFDGDVVEKEITQEVRQAAFDDWTTTDDHGMVIYGIATDQHGNQFYMVKNSWGKYGKYDGMFYASVPFVKMSTTSVMINKNAIPKDIRKKLGL
ncbi:MAG: C1 family peptidase, partial [Bacteroidales bacterium]|nr:C1 family peptidase [Bacteroidales bacterium]